MRRGVTIGLALSPGASAQDMKTIRVVSEHTATGFKFPESVAYDPQAKVLYVSQFGSELKPTEKDGKGRISRVSLDGKILDEQFLPAGSDVLNKPKGIWVEGNRLWVTDINDKGAPKVSVVLSGKSINPNGSIPPRTARF